MLLLSTKIQLRFFEKSNHLSSQMNKKQTVQSPSKVVRTIRKSTRPRAIALDSETKRKSRAKPNPHYQQEEEIRPITSISSIFLEKNPILSPNFYQIDALDLAPRLLGKHLKKDDVVLQITEVEAYRPNDSACHGRFGITARTAPVFGPGGHAYVYLCYGLHTMLNVVADKEGVGAAVLIRSCAPVSGLETVQQRRGLKSEKPVLLAGPGKVGQALGISTEWSNHPLFSPGGLELLDGPEPEKILVGPRVGIEYASPEHVTALWRFAIAGSPWISAPKNTLRSP
ncbi:DNA-3-methyladenine glycosylase isoform X1 [Salvia miltiorrhiza]|uniref:DNA-3-methyladenine glycosylase isoform X1 n=1 Tax=Salvia miltiorrhiza TaxID=226208 RepID=UPI0025ACA2C2|nr:DNA-3-methyladenine glycosylase isoform X1 [Salvia miltiorrhiza]